MASKKHLPFLCVQCAGVGERDPAKCTHEPQHAYETRTAVRAVYDNEGRWRVLWREEDGEEWLGNYRLIPV